MASSRLAIVLCFAALLPSVADAKLKPTARRPFIAGAIAGGAALGLHMGAGLASIRNDAWRPCLVHCDDAFSRPANLAVPLALSSMALLGTAMARQGYEEGRQGGVSRGDRGVIAIGIVSFLLGAAGVVSVARAVETSCAKRCPGIAMSEIPLGAIAMIGVTATAYGAGKRAGNRARLQPSIAIGKTPIVGLAGRF